MLETNTYTHTHTRARSQTNTSTQTHINAMSKVVLSLMSYKIVPGPSNYHNTFTISSKDFQDWRREGLFLNLIKLIKLSNEC